MRIEQKKRKKKKKKMVSLNQCRASERIDAMVSEFSAQTRGTRQTDVLYYYRTRTFDKYEGDVNTAHKRILKNG